MIDWNSIKEAWPFVAVIGGHVVRTEVSRAVAKNKINNLEKSVERVEESHAKNIDRVGEQLDIISADIKHLLERKN